MDYRGRATGDGRRAMDYRGRATGDRGLTIGDGPGTMGLAEVGAPEVRRFVSIANAPVAEQSRHNRCGSGTRFVSANEVASLSSRLDCLRKMLFPLCRRLTP